MDRKSFIKKVAAACIVGVPLAHLWSCTSNVEEMEMDNGNGGEEPSCVDNGTTATITDNHGHTISVSKEDVSAGTEKIYDIEGTSGHSHTVTVTADHFTTLQDNDSVTIVSSNDGHTHSVTITCA